MKNKKLISVLLTLFVATVLMYSCVDDDFDTPPSSPIPIGEIITIEEMKDIYNTNGGYTFTVDVSLYATVTMDDKSGNIYKTAYIQDATGGIALHLDAAGGIYQGDSIRIQLNGLGIGKYKSLFQIDALDGNGFTLDNYITKIQTLVNVEPELVTINDLVNKQGRLVKLENIQFIVGDTVVTYADAVNEESVSLTIQDTLGKTAIVRSSSYAQFADEKTPSGSGSMIAIVGQYNDDMQLIIRTTDEVIMEDERFIPDGGGTGDPVTEFNIDFSEFANYDDVIIADWQSFAETGSRLWQAKEFEGNVYAQGSAYNSTDSENIEWLITPPIDFDVNANEVLSFRSAIAYYTHESFDLLISLDYDGEDYASATWGSLTANIASSGDANYAWVESGDIDLSSYSGIGYIAFKYTGDVDQGETGTFILDDIVLEDKP